MAMDIQPPPPYLTLRPPITRDGIISKKQKSWANFKPNTHAYASTLLGWRGNVELQVAAAAMFPSSSLITTLMWVLLSVSMAASTFRFQKGLVGGI
ncbi:hypothetical protein PIB30_085779 [Stylosanthes scabra]|uniref:Uncharacterized protein n=1 Tax=Stylosanthes scabra TaxID=79078 RepID=A0ABU6SUN7_9FABA|nr:hypothetical protein [Stylosanthes scabra]